MKNFTLSVALIGLVGLFGLIPNISNAMPSADVTLTGAGNDNFQALLEWTVLGEENVAVYRVERSSDGINWTPRGEVFSLNNFAGPQNYHFTDVVPGPGTYSYRLRVNYNDDFAEYTDVIQVIFDASQIVEVFPVPTDKWINISSKSTSLSQVNIYDHVGRQVFSANTEAPNNRFDVSTLPSGTYIIESVHLGGQRTHQSLTISH